MVTNLSHPQSKTRVSKLLLTSVDKEFRNCQAFPSSLSCLTNPRTIKLPPANVVTGLKESSRRVCAGRYSKPSEPLRLFSELIAAETLNGKLIEIVTFGVKVLIWG